MKIRIKKSFISVRIGTEYHHIYIKLGHNGYCGIRWGSWLVGGLMTALFFYCINLDVSICEIVHSKI